jgi:hypothetical protein
MGFYESHVALMKHNPSLKYSLSFDSQELGEENKLQQLCDGKKQL